MLENRSRKEYINNIDAAAGATQINENKPFDCISKGKINITVTLHYHRYTIVGNVLILVFSEVTYEICNCQFGTACFM